MLGLVGSLSAGLIQGFCYFFGEFVYFIYVGLELSDFTAGLGQFGERLFCFFVSDFLLDVVGDLFCGSGELFGLFFEILGLLGLFFFTLRYGGFFGGHLLLALGKLGGLGADFGGEAGLFALDVRVKARGGGELLRELIELVLEGLDFLRCFWVLVDGLAGVVDGFLEAAAGVGVDAAGKVASGLPEPR